MTDNEIKCPCGLREDMEEEDCDRTDCNRCCPLAEEERALDILDKLDFFNQRAGRELWGEKPTDVQDKDIENYSKDVAFLKDFINRQKAEIERLKKDNEYILMQHAFQRRPGGDCWNDVIEKAKAEAVKEFAEIIVADYPEMEYYLDNLVKEFAEGKDNGK